MRSTRTPATDLATAVRRSRILEFIRWVFNESDKVDLAEYDVAAAVTQFETVAAPSGDLSHLNGSEFWEIMDAHQIQLPDPEPTDAELFAAVERSRTGWAVMVKDGDDVDMIELKNPALVTASDVQAHLSALLREGVAFQVFPLIG